MIPRLIVSLAVALILSLTAIESGHAAEKIVEDVTGTVIECVGNEYTITSGALQGIAHENETESGNLLVLEVLVAKNIIAEDLGGNSYTMRGAEQVVFHQNNNSGDLSFIGHVNFNLVGNGGMIADSVHFILHLSPNGNILALDFDECDASI